MKLEDLFDELLDWLRDTMSQMTGYEIADTSPDIKLLACEWLVLMCEHSNGSVPQPGSTPNQSAVDRFQSTSSSLSSCRLHL